MQQATCVHSGADTGTSPGNDEISSAPSRRALLGFAGAGALALAAPIAAAVLPTHVPLEASFSRWKAALYHLNNDGGDDVYDAPYWDQLDKAETEIVRFDAASPRLAAMRVWIALQREAGSAEEQNAVCREDLSFFIHTAEDQDWHVQVMIQALRALGA